MKTVNSNIRHHTAKPYAASAASSRITNLPVFKEATNKAAAAVERINKPASLARKSSDEATFTTTEPVPFHFPVKEVYLHDHEDEDFLEADVSFFDIPTGGIIIMPSREDL